MDIEDLFGKKKLPNTVPAPGKRPEPVPIPAYLNEEISLPALVEPTITLPEGTSPEEKRRRRWERFHELNPHIYTLLVKMTRMLKEKGRTKIGIRMLWERLRWSYAVSTNSDDFKLNDHYTRFYARKIMEDNPDLKGMFEVRERKKTK
jgi:hypothetical protein